MIIKYEHFIKENNEVKPEDFGITNYKWENGLLNCYQKVDISKKDLDKIPFNFGIIEGDFYCTDNKGETNLTSLIGSPKEVFGGFYVYGNKLKNLIGSPEKVHGFFNCSRSPLTSTEGCPKFIDGSFVFRSQEVYFDIDEYPVSIISGGITDRQNEHFKEIKELIKNNKEMFIPLLDNKIRFHQQIMRLRPDLIPEYKTITPPSKISILLDI